MNARDIYGGRTPLDLAAEKGHFEVAKLLIEKGADVDAKDNYDWTPLHYALRNGHLEVAKLLIEKGAKYDEKYKTKDGFTYLMAFSSCGLIDYCKELISKGADVNAENRYGWTSLHFAGDKGHLEVAKLLIEKGAKYDEKYQTKDGVTYLMAFSGCGLIDYCKELISKGADVNAKTNYGLTALHLATENGHLEVAKLLIKKGMDVNAKTNYCWTATALHRAAFKGSVDFAKLLINKGADVNAKTNYGWTALHLATENGHLEVAKLLIEKGAKYDEKYQTKDGVTYLMAFSGCGLIDYCKELISKGADVNAENRYGWTPLHYAAIKGHLEVAKLLIEKGAKYDEKYQTNNGVTYLMAFSGCGLIDYCKELISKGADVNAENRYGWTPLHYALVYRHSDLAQLLIEKGAKYDEKYKTKGGFTYLMAFSSCGLIDYCKELISKGADVNASYYGKTPLHYASENGHLELAKLLIEKGADVNAKGSYNGETPLHYASENGHLELAKLLIEKGADVNAKDTNGTTPLHRTAKNGTVDLPKLLVYKGAEVNAKDSVGKTPLKIAIEFRQTDVANYLISVGGKK